MAGDGSSARIATTESGVTSIGDFKETLRLRRVEDPGWDRFVRACQSDFMFFKTVLGSPTMTFAEFVRHALLHGVEVRKDFKDRDTRGRSEFWRTVRRINLEIGLFPDE